MVVDSAPFISKGFLHCHAEAALFHVVDVSVPLGVPEVFVVEALQSLEAQLVKDPLRLRRRQRREVVLAPGLDRRPQRLHCQSSPDAAASGL